MNTRIEYQFITNISRTYRPTVFPCRKALTNVLKNQAILNASNNHLTDIEIETLCLGLNFIPAHQKTSPSSEIDKWIMDINNAIHFSQTDERATSTNGWLQSIAPSSWMPPPQEWESDPICIEQITKLRKLFTQKPPELHRDITTAAVALGSRSDIHILKADKGRNVVIWPTEEYNREANRNFSDPKVYTELSQREYHQRVTNLALTVQYKADVLLRSGFITQREFDYLTNGDPSGSIIYFLPKTHKPHNATSKTFAGRPIVATYTSSTHGIDQYLTQLTAPILELIPGSLKDTTALLKKLPTEKLPPNTEIYTADVDSLYPSIPWADGLDAATSLYARFLTRLRSLAHEKKRLEPPPIHTFRELLEMVVTNAFITFKNTRFFHQCSGTAMGTCISVYFANAYMYWVTSQVIEKPPQGVLLFERYIDDLIVIIDNKDNDPTWANEFFSTISNDHIKYTINTDSNQQQDYLDVRISIDQTSKILKTEPYKKPTASGNYLHPESTHPRHVIRAIPYSQFLRIRRISSSLDIYDLYAKRLTRELRQSGYKSKDLRKAALRARTLIRDKLLNNDPAYQQPNGQRYINAIKFITPYGLSANWKKVRQQIKRTHNAIKNHYEMKERPNAVRELCHRASELVFKNSRNIGSHFSRHYKNPIFNPQETH